MAVGKQATGLARPGPEGGRIVYASRIPPRPLEAWRFGVQESDLRPSKTEPLALQNGAWGLSNPPLGPPKWSPGPPKWVQIGQKLTRMEVWRPPDAPRAPGRPPGSGPGGPGAAKMEPNGPQDLPKASQNCAKMVPKWVQNLVRKGIRFRLPKNVDF